MRFARYGFATRGRFVVSVRANGRGGASVGGLLGMAAVSSKRQPPCSSIEPPEAGRWRRRERNARNSTTSSEAKEAGPQREVVPRFLASLFWAFRQTKA